MCSAMDAPLPVVAAGVCSMRFRCGAELASAKKANRRPLIGTRRRCDKSAQWAQMGTFTRRRRDKSTPVGTAVNRFCAARAGGAYGLPPGGGLCHASGRRLLRGRKLTARFFLPEQRCMCHLQRCRAAHLTSTPSQATELMALQQKRGCGVALRSALGPSSTLHIIKTVPAPVNAPRAQVTEAQCYY